MLYIYICFICIHLSTTVNLVSEIPLPMCFTSFPRSFWTHNKSLIRIRNHTFLAPILTKMKDLEDLGISELWGSFNPVVETISFHGHDMDITHTCTYSDTQTHVEG